MIKNTKKYMRRNHHPLRINCTILYNESYLPPPPGWKIHLARRICILFHHQSEYFLHCQFNKASNNLFGLCSKPNIDTKLRFKEIHKKLGPYSSLFTQNKEYTTLKEPLYSKYEFNPFLLFWSLLLFILREIEL